jgi:hypothetical protein
MNRIAIIIILGSLCLLSGCIEVSYKTEASVSLFKKTKKPTIVDNGYPTLESEVAAILAEKEQLQSSDKNRHTMSLITNEPKRRGFTAFKRRER